MSTSTTHDPRPAYIEHVVRNLLAQWRMPQAAFDRDRLLVQLQHADERAVGDGIRRRRKR